MLLKLIIIGTLNLALKLLKFIYAQRKWACWQLYIAAWGNSCFKPQKSCDMPSANGTQPANVYHRADLWCFIPNAREERHLTLVSPAVSGVLAGGKKLYLIHFKWYLPVDSEATTIPDWEKNTVYIDIFNIGLTWYGWQISPQSPAHQLN